ncbi:MAG: alpha/beta hydrolase [Lachnospiraceae bacterium]|nr:alpha/beta hydrolase [Lachnospiraceae bacterium]
MVHKYTTTIPALTGDEPRGVYVYLPDSYEWDSGRRYPVLYMFDGHNVFFDSDATYGKCWGMKEYMDYTGTQMIIAAVECNHSPDHGRLKEYTPFAFENPSVGKIDARGKLTMDWMVHEFKEDIDRRYRTLPDRDHTFIAGSSMGGLMSLYALLDYPQYFSRAAALSPSLWVAPEKLLRMIRNAEVRPGTVLYMDYGEQEFGNHADMAKSFAKIQGKLLEKGILLTGRIVPGGTHCEASWERQIPIFMKVLEG